MKSGTSQHITFKSKPAGAEIWLNGKKHPALTPATIELPKDHTTFQFKKAGFATHSETLQFRTCSWFYWSLAMGVLAGGLDWISGAWKEFDLPEEGIVRELKLSTLGETEDDVYISSNPVGASIKIAGVDVQGGGTGTKGRGKKVIIKWGDPRTDRERPIMMKFTGYEDANLSIRRGQKELHWDFVQKPDEIATLFESRPFNAEVLINGVKKIGQTPGTVNLSWYTYPTEYVVEYRLTGYKPWRKTIKSKNEGPKIMAVLEEIEIPALLRIDCVPSGSAIEVDGRPAGEAPSEIKLIWTVNRKSCKLTFSRPGYESHEETVTDTQRSVSVRLRPALPRLP